MAVGVQAIEDLGAEVVDRASRSSQVSTTRRVAASSGTSPVGWVRIRREAWLPPFDVAIGYDRDRVGPGHTEP